jgi:hypothetical protein
VKLKSKERRGLGAIAGAVYGSGALLFVLSSFVRVPTAIGEQRHPAEPGVRIVHAVCAYGAVVAFGYLLRGHVLPGLRSRERKRAASGLGAVALFAALVVSALFLLYGGESAWAAGIALTHGILGLACPALIVIHAWKRTRAARASAPGKIRPARRAARSPGILFASPLAAAPFGPRQPLEAWQQSVAVQASGTAPPPDGHPTPPEGAEPARSMDRDRPSGKPIV